MLNDASQYNVAVIKQLYNVNSINSRLFCGHWNPKVQYDGMSCLPIYRLSLPDNFHCCWMTPTHVSQPMLRKDWCYSFVTQHGMCLGQIEYITQLVGWITMPLYRRYLSEHRRTDERLQKLINNRILMPSTGWYDKWPSWRGCNGARGPYLSLYRQRRRRRHLHVSSTCMTSICSVNNAGSYMTAHATHEIVLLHIQRPLTKVFRRIIIGEVVV